MLFVLPAPYSTFRKYDLMNVNRPKRVVKIKIKIKNIYFLCL